MKVKDSRFAKYHRASPVIFFCLVILLFIKLLIFSPTHTRNTEAASRYNNGVVATYTTEDGTTVHIMCHQGYSFVVIPITTNPSGEFGGGAVSTFPSSSNRICIKN